MVIWFVCRSIHLLTYCTSFVKNFIIPIFEIDAEMKRFTVQSSKFCQNGYFAYVESYEKKGMTLSSTHFHSQTYTLVLLAIILGQWGVMIILLYKSENKTISGAWIYSGLGKEFHSQICKGNQTILSLLRFIVEYI